MSNDRVEHHSKRAPRFLLQRNLLGDVKGRLVDHSLPEVLMKNGHHRIAQETVLAESDLEVVMVQTAGILTKVQGVLKMHGARHPGLDEQARSLDEILHQYQKIASTISTVKGTLTETREALEKIPFEDAGQYQSVVDGLDFIDKALSTLVNSQRAAVADISERLSSLLKAFELQDGVAQQSLIAA